MTPGSLFHPAVAAWFERSFAAPTAAQAQAWPAFQAGRHVLIAAPTGSGKTLAAFLAAIDGLVRQGLDGTLRDETQVVYISPLKALSNDVHKNLERPLAEIRALAEERGIKLSPIRVGLRTGDTNASDRQRMLRERPHILVTTPESLYILLTAERPREMLAGVRTVIVDEIHAVADDKRGSHLALTLARLDRLVEQSGLPRPQRICHDVRHRKSRAETDAQSRNTSALIRGGDRQGIRNLILRVLVHIAEHVHADARIQHFL